MKLRQLSPGIALYELRDQIGNLLSESISDYLALTIALIKNDKPVDLDQLAGFISGLKVIGNSEHRGSLTKDDLGINPNDFKDLFNTLNSITKDGKNVPRVTSEVFVALKSITPSTFKKTRQELEVLENGTAAQKDQAIKKLQIFMTKVNQLFYKLKHGSTQPKVKAAPSVTDTFDSVNFPA